MVVFFHVRQPQEGPVTRGQFGELPPEALLGLMAMLRPHLDAAGWAKLAAAAGVAA